MYPAPGVPFKVGNPHALRPIARVTGPAASARIPGCRQFVIPGADHMLPLRVPGRLAEIIAEQAG